MQSQRKKSKSAKHRQGRQANTLHEIKTIVWQNAEVRLITWWGNLGQDDFTLEAQEDQENQKQKLLKKAPVSQPQEEEKEDGRKRKMATEVTYSESRNVQAKVEIYRLMFLPKANLPSVGRVLLLDGPAMRVSQLLLSLDVDPKRMDIPQNNALHLRAMKSKLTALAQQSEDDSHYWYDNRRLTQVHLRDGALFDLLSQKSAPKTANDRYSIIFLDYCCTWNDSVRADVNLLFGDHQVARGARFGITCSERCSQVEVSDRAKIFQESSLIQSMIQSELTQIAVQNGYTLQFKHCRSYGSGGRMQFFLFDVL